jgi:putative addiction module CopG family antidote
MSTPYDERQEITMTHSTTFPPDLERFIEQAIAQGRYRSSAELFFDAVRLLRDREMSREDRLKELRESIEEAAQQIERGECTVLNNEAEIDAFFEEILAEDDALPSGSDAIAEERGK